MNRLLPLALLFTPLTALAGSGSSAPSGTVLPSGCHRAAPGSANEALCTCIASAAAGDAVTLYNGPTTPSGIRLPHYSSGGSCYDLDKVINPAGLSARNQFTKAYASNMATAEGRLSSSYPTSYPEIKNFGLRDTDGDWTGRDDEAFIAVSGGTDPSDGPDKPLPIIGLIVIDPMSGHHEMEDENGNPMGTVFSTPGDEITAIQALDIGDDGILDAVVFTQSGASLELHSIGQGGVYDLGGF